jgi:SAM-dependent methyltransferase
VSNADAWGLFADEAERYDSTVELVAPFYRKMHDMLLTLAVDSITSADQALGRPLFALDIGSGTGAEAIPLLQALPHLNLVGVDSSAAMNKVFAQRAKRLNVSADRFHLLQADIFDPSAQDAISSRVSRVFGGAKFHLIISAFTLHHFAKEQKAAAFRLIYDMLESDGVFLLGDLFNFDGESTWLSETISDWETRWFASNFDQEAKNAKAIADAPTESALKLLKDKWLRHYQEENVLDSVTTELSLLKEVGFQEVGNPFRYWQVGLIFAKK